MKKLFTLILGSTVLVCAGADLLNNGSFEAPVTADGKIPGWTVEKSEIVPDGIKGKAIAVTSHMKLGKNMLRGKVVTRSRNFTAGKKYMLSGACRNAHALFIVAQFDWGNKKTKQFSAWIGKNKFRDAEEEGWQNFSTMIDVPENAEILNIIIEPIAIDKKENTPRIILDEIKLEALD